MESKRHVAALGGGCPHDRNILEDGKKPHDQVTTCHSTTQESLLKCTLCKVGAGMPANAGGRKRVVARHFRKRLSAEECGVHKRPESAGANCARSCHFLSRFFVIRKKFGQSSTHWNKLIPRVNLGGGGECPLILIGIEPPRVTGFESVEMAFKAGVKLP